MMGQQPRTEPLFYYFRLEDQIPEDHLLKRLDRFIDFGFVRERLRNTYSAIGRPSIDPEVLLRLLLVGYLYGITSERRLIEEVRMHLAYRWFSRLGFERFRQPRHDRPRQRSRDPLRTSGAGVGQGGRHDSGRPADRAFGHNRQQHWTAPALRR